MYIYKIIIINVFFTTYKVNTKILGYNEGTFKVLSNKVLC